MFHSDISGNTVVVVEHHTDKGGRLHVNKKVEAAEEVVRLAG